MLMQEKQASTRIKMKKKFKGEYPPEWTKELRNSLRSEFDNKCERCSHIHEPKAGYALTVHHLDNDKSNLTSFSIVVVVLSFFGHPRSYRFYHLLVSSDRALFGLVRGGYHGNI